MIIICRVDSSGLNPNGHKLFLLYSCMRTNFCQSKLFILISSDPLKPGIDVLRIFPTNNVNVKSTFMFFFSLSLLYYY